MRLKLRLPIGLLIFIFFAAGIISGGFFIKGASGMDEAVKRDPFMPLVSKSGVILIPREINIVGMSLKGIIYSEDNPVAIINDEVLKVNNKIGEYTVLKIEEKEVLLRKGNRVFTLRLEEE